MADLRELYQEVILDHNKSPRNFHAVKDANRTVKGFNPLCGDQYVITARIEDGVVKDIGFEGSGCAISKASASVMTTSVKGKTVDEAERLIDRFHDLVTGHADAKGETTGYEKMVAFAGVSEFPTRVKCATLAWHTLRALLETREEMVSTE